MLTSVTIANILDSVLIYFKPNKVLSNDFKYLGLTMMASLRMIVVLLQDMVM
jgi:hypothetical protein